HIIIISLHAHNVNRPAFPTRRSSDLSENRIRGRGSGGETAGAAALRNRPRRQPRGSWREPDRSCSTGWQLPQLLFQQIEIDRLVDEFEGAVFIGAATPLVIAIRRHHHDR